MRNPQALMNLEYKLDKNPAKYHPFGKPLIIADVFISRRNTPSRKSLLEAIGLCHETGDLLPCDKPLPSPLGYVIGDRKEIGLDFVYTSVQLYEILCVKTEKSRRK